MERPESDCCNIRAKWQCISGIVVQGHGVASGMAENSRYPRSTIRMQKPFFRERGVDLSLFHEGTLNVSIQPYVFKMIKPWHTFRQIEWTTLHPPEDFSFSRCTVLFENTQYPGLIYYPHPETKETHFQDPSVLEILTHFVTGIGYGDRVEVTINPAEISLYQP